MTKKEINNIIEEQTMANLWNVMLAMKSKSKVGLFYLISLTKKPRIYKAVWKDKKNAVQH